MKRRKGGGGAPR